MATHVPPALHEQQAGIGGEGGRGGGRDRERERESEREGWGRYDLSDEQPDGGRCPSNLTSVPSPSHLGTPAPPETPRSSSPRQEETSVWLVCNETSILNRTWHMQACWETAAQREINHS